MTSVAPLDLFDAPNHEWLFLDGDTNSNSDEDLAECLMHESAAQIQRAVRARARHKSDKQRTAHGNVPRVEQGSRMTIRSLHVLILVSAISTTFIAGRDQAGQGDESIKLLAAPEADLKSKAMTLFGRQEPLIDTNQHAVLAIPCTPSPSQLELTWEVTCIQVLVVMLLASTALEIWFSKAARSVDCSFGPLASSTEKVVSGPSVDCSCNPHASSTGKAVSAKAPKNPWNEFQHCVKGCCLDRKMISRLYKNYREAGIHLGADKRPSCRPTPTSLLISSASTWEGFCAAVSGCGLDREKTKRLYTKVKSMSA